MANKRSPRIHITAVGSNANQAVERLGNKGIDGLLACASKGAGPRYQITASEKMIFAKQQDELGGRLDDVQRAREIENLLANDKVAALVTLRGGAWFTRILNRINFDVLKSRDKTIHLFGFSEMTSLIAVAGRYPRAVGIHDLGPCFLYQSLNLYAKKNFKKLNRAAELSPDQTDGFAAGWALANYPQAFSEFFRDVADVLDGKGSKRVPAGRLLAGTLPAVKTITITGGNLSVIAALTGSQFKRAVNPRGKWLALEEVNESADRIDRMMAGLKLNGLFERTVGIILGKFCNHNQDLSETAFNILKHHLPTKKRIPIVALENFGHIYPMAPLPLHRQVNMRCNKSYPTKPRVTIDIPWAKWAIQ